MYEEEQKYNHLKKELTEIEDDGPWTLFYDMHSGGGTKIKPFENIYIQAEETEASIIFYKLFNRKSNNITCSCCGKDYGIHTDSSFSELSKYYRQYWDKKNKKYLTNEQHSNKKDVLVLHKKDLPFSDEELNKFKNELLEKLLSKSNYDW